MFWSYSGSQASQTGRNHQHRQPESSIALYSPLIGIPQASAICTAMPWQRRLYAPEKLGCTIYF
jgi:hypothetical protein